MKTGEYLPRAARGAASQVSKPRAGVYPGSTFNELPS